MKILTKRENASSALAQLFMTTLALLFAGLILSCANGKVSKSDNIKVVQKFDAASPQLDKKSGLVRIVLSKQYSDAGRLDYRIQLKRGDIIRLRPINDPTESSFLYRYKSERVIEATKEGRYYKVNGKIVGAVISGESSAVDVTALYKERKRIRSVVWLNDYRISKKAIDAVRQLESDHILLTYGRVPLVQNGEKKLKAISEKIGALHLLYPQPGEPVGKTSLDTQMMRIVKVFDKAKELFVTPHAFFDSALIALARNPRLRGLYAEGSYITDQQMKIIARMVALRELNVARSRITDIGLSHIISLKRLRSLDIRDTMISDLGLKHVSRLRQLQSLNLTGTKIVGAGLKHLSGLKALRGLSVANTAVSDLNAKALTGLSTVTELDIMNTRISDISVKWFSRMKHLRYFFIKGTRISDLGVKRLRRSVPGCIVHSN